MGSYWSVLPSVFLSLLSNLCSNASGYRCEWRDLLMPELSLLCPSIWPSSWSNYICFCLTISRSCTYYSANFFSLSFTLARVCLSACITISLIAEKFPVKSFSSRIYFSLNSTSKRWRRLSMAFVFELNSSFTSVTLDFIWLISYTWVWALVYSLLSTFWTAVFSFWMWVSSTLIWDVGSSFFHLSCHA